MWINILRLNIQNNFQTFAKHSMSYSMSGPQLVLLRGGFRLSQVSHLTKVSEKKVGKKESYCFTGHSQLSVKS